jgi:phosphoesterase RecJ-like protein
MNEIFRNIEDAKHIELITKPEFLAVSSALYTHILRLHKKVSLVCTSSNIDKKYAFLPWFEKIKRSDTPSADVRIACNFSVKSLYEAFVTENIKPNQKMATALYAALIDETQGFTQGVDGTIFAMAQVLIECGAEHKLCVRFMRTNASLAFLRLKALMLKKLLLQNDAKAALFCVSESEINATGANLENAYIIMQEAFALQYVEMAILLQSDAEYEIKKVIYKESSFEK